MSEKKNEEFFMISSTPYDDTRIEYTDDYTDDYVDDYFEEEIDWINEKLETLCKPFSDYRDALKCIEQADAILRMKGLYLDQNEIDEVENGLEELEALEALTFTIPVYRNQEQTDYNLVITYFKNEDTDQYEIDLDLQYFWESDDYEDDYEDDYGDGYEDGYMDGYEDSYEDETTNDADGE